MSELEQIVRALASIRTHLYVEKCALLHIRESISYGDCLPDVDPDTLCMHTFDSIVGDLVDASDALNSFINTLNKRMPNRQ